MPPIRIVAAGDAALLVSLPQVIDASLNAWCVAFAEAVAERYGAGVRDAVVGYASVTVYFDPVLVDPEWLERELQDLAARLPATAVRSGAVIDVPVLYGGEMGPDIADVAAFGGCAVDDVVAWHAAVTYRVYLVGFVPGFAYLATVDPRIAAPRRATPRLAMPIGAVAIAGGQTGIYPDTTPGGWNIIGRTPLLPFDPERESPSLFKPGDQVRFQPITEAEFAAFPARGSR
ncbi:MAG: 5-oxoprolinase subunit PxpB [Vicinamibacterales bacterium]